MDAASRKPLWTLLYDPRGGFVAAHLSFESCRPTERASLNEQLKNSTHRLFAINGGDDLFGMLLMPTEAAEAQKSLPDKRDWPYLPEDQEPWYGQNH